MKKYNAQVELLIQCLPTIAKVDVFVLKGGTAINLFVRQDFPRLSVDIDLIYLPIQNRIESLLGIEAGLIEIQKKLREQLNQVSVITHKNQQTKTITSLIVERQGVQIKVEPNLVLRGTVDLPIKRDLSQVVVDQYGLSVINMPVAAVSDLYAGKICAALDRQHPRDLFDLKPLLEQGLAENIKKVFLVYLASHNRPINELLQTNSLDLIKIYQEEFFGMTTQEVSYESLLAVREDLINTLKKSLTKKDQEFLLGIKQGTVNGELLGLTGIELLPGIQWKLLNIKKMNKVAQQRALDKLQAVLDEYNI